MTRDNELIRASEVGTYAYCARAWWLQAVRGVSSQNVQALQAGARRHARHGSQVARVYGLQILGYALLALALVLVATWLLALEARMGAAF
jgi:hypothetical protein